jgi:jumonji domain-containing protein 7
MIERYYPHARYEREISRTLKVVPSDGSVPDVRWSSIENPDVPGVLPDSIEPIQVTLRKGETLYLPVGWWHFVKQSGLTIALNWWYDAELRGMSWVLLSFLRNPSQIPSVNDENAD